MIFIDYRRPLSDLQIISAWLVSAPMLNKFAIRTKQEGSVLSLSADEESVRVMVVSEMWVANACPWEI